MSYREYKKLDLPVIDKEIGAFWERENIFEKSMSNKEGKPKYIFYEGPPSANGMPGIHHVLSRSFKDLFCRYKTMQGFIVKRKGGWDTHGLPVELGVEKALNITKDDIGNSISIEDYNARCRTDVMKFKKSWDDLTKQMGYWVDLKSPYITFENNYIESVWNLLKKLFDKGYLYKGYSVQPYSPAAGTGLSSHELNLPGCYRDVTDTSVTAQFEMIKDDNSSDLYEYDDEKIYFLAWTTTPWTLTANVALAVGEKIKYVKVKTYNPFTFKPVSVILASELVDRYFIESKDGFIRVENDAELLKYNAEEKPIPYMPGSKSYTGKDLESINYQQLMPYVQPDGDAFRVIIGDFVTTDEGTGIVHTASVFGADDFRVCQQNGIASALVKDEDGNDVPVVDKHGKFVSEITDFAGRFVRSKYEDDETLKDKSYKSTDILIAIKLKEENKAFKVEKYVHSYPHCWRTDKPILYYPLDAWFIKTTELKKRMVELNSTINWVPSNTGTGRFGNWLENLVDWNLSRSRFWGTPLPIWMTEDKQQIKCIGSLEELRSEVKAAVDKGLMKEELPKDFDMHRPFVDEIKLVTEDGQTMHRETDLIDVWFDSGAMPYAQWHYPFENEAEFEQSFPADFISEGVDQTRGWFFTLHAISVMLYDSVAFKNVLSHGLVLDKEGNKMSKRIGNVVDPFNILNKYGADATRWFLISNSNPWENLKFNEESIGEIQRKFFGTLHNTYAFYSLYANIDNFNNDEKDVAIKSRPDMDRWIISLLNSLIKSVEEAYDKYDPTTATRLITNFVVEHLSNWYVRLCRRRFWKGEYNEDKIAAYQTLNTCLVSVAKLMAPAAPFYADNLFGDLKGNGDEEHSESVHLVDFPHSDDAFIDKDLELQMQIAQDISSIVLSLRKKADIKVRQPLSKILVPIIDEKMELHIEKVKDLILSEVNVKSIEYAKKGGEVFNKKIKPNFKELGKKYGPLMKGITEALKNLNEQEIASFEDEDTLEIEIDGKKIILQLSDVEIESQDVPGWLNDTKNGITVALDIEITEVLKDEGIARELVNKIQNIRKDLDFKVTDRINVEIEKAAWIQGAIKNNFNYICSEILAEKLEFQDSIKDGQAAKLNNETIMVSISKVK